MEFMTKVTMPWNVGLIDFLVKYYKGNNVHVKKEKKRKTFLSYKHKIV